MSRYMVAGLTHQITSSEKRGYMGKICIVKRRKCENQIEYTTTESTEMYVLEKPMFEDLESSAGPSLAWPPSLPRNGTASEEQKLTIHLTPAQAEVAKSHSYFNVLLGTEADGSGVHVERSEDGKIAFNFYFKQVYFARMLTRSDVCSMLQISRSFLSKLVKSGSLTSYKIGRLRRFSLEDILARLGESKEVLLKGEEQCTTNIGV